MAMPAAPLAGYPSYPPKVSIRWSRAIKALVSGFKSRLIAPIGALEDRVPGWPCTHRPSER